MIRTFNDSAKNINSISSEEMLILQARILASIASLVKNSKLLSIFPSRHLLGNPGVEELGRLHHYYDNVLKNNRVYELTPAMEQEISSIAHDDKNRFINGLVELLQNEQPISNACLVYIVKVAKCFGVQHSINHLRADELADVVDNEG